MAQQSAGCLGWDEACYTGGMARRKKPVSEKTPPTPGAPPPLDALLAAQAAHDPRAWEAMLNLNKMRAARRGRDRATSPAAVPETKDRD